MGTNYYRVPSQEEMTERWELLIQRAQKLDVNEVANIQNNFRTIYKMDRDRDCDRTHLWDEFTEDLSVHLGKRSGGWKFLWNFHDNRYYSDKEELFSYIRSGRVVDEYGKEIDVEEFITMALEWCTDGYDMKKYRQEHPRQYHYDFEKPELYIDGLRVSDSTNFS